MMNRRKLLLFSSHVGITEPPEPGIDDWTEYVFNLTANTTAGKIRAYPHTSGSAGDSVFLDKITIEKTS